jgi:phosphate-selective porin OprO/OprP
MKKPSASALGTDLPISVGYGPVGTAGYDATEGFFISDKDKQYFFLHIGGRLQARYTFQGFDGNDKDPDDGGLDRSYFSLPRVRLILSGYVLTPDLNYKMEWDGGTEFGETEKEQGTLETLDAYVLYKAGRALGLGDNPGLLAIGVGQFKPYFLRQEKVSSGKFQFVERSMANEFFNTDRVLGAWVQSDLDPVFAAFTVANGFDSLNGDPDSVDQIPAFMAKLDWSIVGPRPEKTYEESNVRCEEKPVWVVGLSGATDENNGTTVKDSRRFKCYEFGVDTVFKYGIFSLQAEYMGRWVEFPDGYSIDNVDIPDTETRYVHGFYVQGGVFIVPQTLELGARVSEVISDSGPQSGNGLEVGPVLNWFISKSHKIKLQTDVSWEQLAKNMPIQTESLDATNVTYPFTSQRLELHSGERGWMWRMQFQIEF